MHMVYALYVLLQVGIVVLRGFEAGVNGVRVGTQNWRQSLISCINWSRKAYKLLLEARAYRCSFDFVSGSQIGSCRGACFSGFPSLANDVAILRIHNNLNASARDSFKIEV